MSLAELTVWKKYRRKHGPMSPVRLYDRPAALIAESIYKSTGGRARASDYMPWGKNPPEMQDQASIIRKQFGGLNVCR